MTLYDLYTPVKIGVKQFFCKHNYVHKVRPCGFQEFRISECTKCGYVKVREL